jgi:hypothetical protein
VIIVKETLEMHRKMTKATQKRRKNDASTASHSQN